MTSTGRRTVWRTLAVLSVALVVASASAQPKTPPIVRPAPSTWILVYDATGPATASVAALTTPRTLIELVVRSDPDMVLAAQGVAPPPSPSVRRLSIEPRIVALARVGPAWRAYVQLIVSDERAQNMLGMCAGAATVRQTLSTTPEVTSVENATRAAWSTCLDHLPR